MCGGAGVPCRTRFDPRVAESHAATKTPTEKPNTRRGANVSQSCASAVAVVRSAPAGPEQVEDDAEEDRGDEDGEALLGDI